MGQALIIPWTWAGRAEQALAYARTARLIEQRCQQILASGRHDEWGTPCDDCGTVDEYRLDARACAGMAARIKKEICPGGDHRDNWTPPDDWPGLWEWREIHGDPADADLMGAAAWRELPTDPEDLARWAWDTPWKRNAPPPSEEELKELRWADFMDVFTEREAEAMIMVYGELKSPLVVAETLGCSVQRVRNLLSGARAKCRHDA